jgi:hypothetical protein
VVSTARRHDPQDGPPHLVQLSVHCASSHQHLAVSQCREINYKMIY